MTQIVMMRVSSRTSWSVRAAFASSRVSKVAAGAVEALADAVLGRQVGVASVAGGVQLPAAAEAAHAGLSGHGAEA